MRQNLVLKVFSLIFLIAALPVVPCVQAAPYTFDQEHSRVQFFLKHLGILTTHGEFKSFKGNSQFSHQAVESSNVQLNIQTASLRYETKVTNQDLLSEKFFWPEKYPEVSFYSSRFIRKNGNRFDIEGYLTIRGITRKVIFQTRMITEPSSIQENQPLSFTASTFIKRKDYKLGSEDWTNPFLVLAGETLEIRLTVKCIPVPEDKTGSA